MSYREEREVVPDSAVSVFHVVTEAISHSVLEKQISARGSSDVVGESLLVEQQTPVCPVQCISIR